jgi:hypothetical protein
MSDIDPFRKVDRNKVYKPIDPASMTQFGGYPLWTPFACRYAVVREVTLPIPAGFKVLDKDGNEFVGPVRYCNRRRHKSTQGYYNLDCRGGKSCPAFAYTGQPCQWPEPRDCPGWED